MAKKNIEKILKILARAVLKKQVPQIVSITGSIGKTSTKEAIYFVLRKKFRVRRNTKNYNNEIGVPLTILGEVSPGKSILGWLKVFLKFFNLIIFKKKNYPGILILETAADKPGDLKYLMEIFPSGLLRVAVLTAVAPVHLQGFASQKRVKMKSKISSRIEFFGGLDNIFKEKIIPFSFLKKDGFAIVNKDNCDFEKMNLASRFITYGIEKDSDLMARDIKVDRQGLRFDLVYQGESFHFFLKGGISSHQIYSLLAAVSVGLCYGMGIEQASLGLRDYEVLAGRMHQLKGLNNSIIIDDTYNSSPQAVKKGLRSLADLPFGERKIAVLGAMLELGEESDNFHRLVGGLAAKEKEIDYLITLGDKGKIISEGALGGNMSREKVFNFETLKEISDFLKGFIQKDDVLLVKGSQGTRMEKIVQEIILEPEKAKDLLVRQGEEWQDK